MDAYVLDKTYNAISIVDSYESFIWTDRYCGYGDFEIAAPYDEKIFSDLKSGEYLSIKNSNRFMVIESFEIETSSEDSDMLIVTGRSLESILERRVIWPQTVLTGNFQEGIKKILNESVISPTNPDRAIPGFTFKMSSDPRITSLEIDSQFFGDEVYSTIVKLCEEKNLGFKVLPSGSGGFEFELFYGTDRSYDQNERPYVVFSPKFDNILSSNYVASKKTLKNVALIGGEGDGSERKIAEYVIDPKQIGLSRREIFIDASSVSSATDDGELTSDEYNAQLIEKGKEGLAEHKETETFEGEVEALTQFVYGTHFFIGDILQIVDERGLSAKTRVSELMIANDTTGFQMNPTFEKIEKEAET